MFIGFLSHIFLFGFVDGRKQKRQRDSVTVFDIPTGLVKSLYPYFPDGHRLLTLYYAADPAMIACGMLFTGR